MRKERNERRIEINKNGGRKKEISDGMKKRSEGKKNVRRKKDKKNE